MRWYLKLLTAGYTFLAAFFFFLPANVQMDWTFRIWSLLISAGFSLAVIVILRSRNAGGFETVMLLPLIFLGSVVFTGLLQQVSNKDQLVFTLIVVSFSTVAQGITWLHCWRKILLQPQQQRGLATS